MRNLYRRKDKEMHCSGVAYNVVLVNISICFGKLNTMLKNA